MSSSPAQKIATSGPQEGQSPRGDRQERSALTTTSPGPRVVPFPAGMQPRRFPRVPTHAVGAHPEQREYPRATLRLPLKLRSVNGLKEDFSVSLVTRDI